MEYAEKGKNVGLGELSWFGQKYIYWKSWQKEFKKKKLCGLEFTFHSCTLAYVINFLSFMDFYYILLKAWQSLSIIIAYFRRKRGKNVKQLVGKTFP